jgi:hypothetical protein
MLSVNEQNVMRSNAKKLHRNAVDLTGKKFAYLTIIKFSHSNCSGTNWLSKCICGKQLTVIGCRLTRKCLPPTPMSCGCITGKRHSQQITIHGMSRHPAYRVWSSMKSRCLNLTDKNYKNYGDRGITVCKRWQQSFQNFWDDMNSTYKEGLTLDRKNNDGNYSKRNCRWATPREQANNRRNNKRIKTKWGYLTLAEASRKSGILSITIRKRVAAGWNEKDLLKPAWGK